jgi:hypothetical protein
MARPLAKRTIAALLASIAHHKTNLRAAEPYDVRLGSDECALCGLFIDKLRCGNCPVKLKTGEEGCVGSPYEELSKAHTDWCDRYGYRSADEGRKNFQRAERKEIKFLKSLLPEEVA